MIPNSTAAVQNHIRHSRQYRENAFIALENDEAGKAGELLWGSLAQALQAVAAYHNKPIRPHRDLKNFAIQLAREVSDPSIEKNFVVAESLHHNFYVIQQERSDIEIVVPTIQELVSKLFGLIPIDLIEKAANP